MLRIQLKRISLQTKIVNNIQRTASDILVDVQRKQKSV